MNVLARGQLAPATFYDLSYALQSTDQQDEPLAAIAHVRGKELHKLFYLLFFEHVVRSVSSQ